METRPHDAQEPAEVSPAPTSSSSSGRPVVRAMSLGIAAGTVLLIGHVLWPIVQGNRDDVTGAKPRRLTTSIQCSQSLDDMVRDKNWQYANKSATDWCRVRLENEFTQCCQMAEFAKGRAEGCSGCAANCEHYLLMTMCNKYYGTACSVRRKPFFTSGARGLEVLESFCVPRDCMNTQDREALMGVFAVTYKPLRYGWTENYDETILECPSAAGLVILLICVTILAVCLGLPLAYLLFVAPQERGRVLVSQGDMKAPEEEASGDQDGLRNTANGGGDTLTSFKTTQ
eukprot:gnl/TRDRNA2_/TRDRNA2_181642_c0_seq1.p1 gnl/TRDRNA2_/TRDRNA2_181642_c0~~gnl/TRDRNA2_/TRDRNA2_181642_c0_seq1.p1  ORF type:complete len:286 (-),score=29.55 gnl/TRDRNA2_/TRDRNA2_181642_c0_seq1:170-1027(-)